MERRKISEQDLGRLFFTADLHFGHTKIHLPEYANRPWDTVEEMDEALIECWNAKIIDPKSLVVVVGDLTMDERKLPLYVPRLNGRILYVQGDHGVVKPGGKYSELFEGVFHLLRLSMPGDRPDIVCCHWAMRRWPKAHYGAWHLFGHSHGELPTHGLSFDCGVDSPMATGTYAHLSYQEAARKMGDIKASTNYRHLEHHGRRF